MKAQMGIGGSPAALPAGPGQGPRQGTAAPPPQPQQGQSAPPQPMGAPGVPGGPAPNLPLQ